MSKDLSNILSVLGLDPIDLTWHDLAMCKGTDREDFYDKYESSESVAKTTDQMCLSCPVLQECLKAGVENGEYGVWGGVYLTAGRADPNRNAHKTKEVWKELRARVGSAL